MRQAVSLQNESPLLGYAISRLSPEVFSHPVWVRFGQKELCSQSGLADDLFHAATRLQPDDPSAACQILLLCAVYQNYSGQPYNALETTRQVISLAETTNLANETIWARWAACAIAFQQGNHDEAAKQLIDLQAAFSSANEWILANLIDVLRQSIFQHSGDSAGNQVDLQHADPYGEVLAFIHTWLRGWGFSQQASAEEFDPNPVYAPDQTHTRASLSTSFFSIQQLRGRWHTLLLAFRSEWKLQWVQHRVPSVKQRHSVLGSFLRTLQAHLAGHSVEPPLHDLPEVPDTPLLTPVMEYVPPKEPLRVEESSHAILENNAQKRPEKAATAMPLSVQMLGAFSLMIGDRMLKLSSSRSLSLFKYLLFHHKQTLSRDLLMEIFWPDAEPETARNSLNVAIHSLRRSIRSLTDAPLIVFENGAYSLAPGWTIWLDLEEFERRVRAGQRLEERNQLTAAVAEYEAAVSLYLGDFLEQNPYEEWTIFDRERLRIAYLDMLDRLSQIYFRQERFAACIASCQLLLARDACREDAHCLLMRCYSRQGQHHLALRQYQMCVEALRGELQVEPAPETTQLHNRIRRREQV